MAIGLLSRLFSRVFAGSLVRQAYAGILGREPDKAGLAAHAASVRRTGRLAPVLKTMVDSEEAWQRAVRLHAEDGAALTPTGPADWHHVVWRDGPTFVAAAYTALLDREPDAAELQAQSQWLAEHDDVAAFLSGIGRSEEHTARVLERQGLPAGPVLPVTAGQGGDFEATVVAAFQGLLGRHPDPDALTAYTALLCETGDLASFLAELSDSVEHRKRLLLRTTART